MSKRSTRARVGLLAVAGTVSALALASVGVASAAPAQPTGYLYTSSNDIAAGKNTVAGFAIWANGKLTPLKQGEVKTGGTGLNNGYIAGVNKGNAKLGPMDNDTPVVATPNGKFVYVINGNSDTIAGFSIGANGALTKIPGSPFASGGINPTSIAVNPAGTFLAVGNRNEDPARQDLLKSGKANLVNFRIGANGALTKAGSADIVSTTYGIGNQPLPTQVLFPAKGNVLFSNNFRIDAPWNVLNGDPSATYSQQWSATPQVLGNIQSLVVGAKGAIATSGDITMPDVPPAAEAGAPSIPLNLWSHPTKKILYTNLVTRNAVGVMTYDDKGDLTFVKAVPSSGRDVCWLRTNAAGTRLYEISNNSNKDLGDTGSSIEVFDISGDKALAPVEIQHINIPTQGTDPFVNDRGQTQAGSTAFIPTLSPDNKYFYVGMQRVNQVPGNTNPNGNAILGYKVNADGTLSAQPIQTVNLSKVGFPTDSRAWGLAAVAAK
jgi:6-phosphogluconolactonase (cycloisomerase 2 family)